MPAYRIKVSGHYDVMHRKSKKFCYIEMLYYLWSGPSRNLEILR